MFKIPKQEYTVQFKELAVKRVKDGQGIGAVAKELGLVKQTLRNWGKGGETAHSLAHIRHVSREPHPRTQRQSDHQAGQRRQHRTQRLDIDPTVHSNAAGRQFDVEVAWRWRRRWIRQHRRRRIAYRYRQQRDLRRNFSVLTGAIFVNPFAHQVGVHAMGGRGPYNRGARDDALLCNRPLRLQRMLAVTSATPTLTCLKSTPDDHGVHPPNKWTPSPLNRQITRRYRDESG
jgi:Transposase